MTGNYVLGMDCGTTNIKAVIIGGDGKVVAEASRPSRFYRPQPDMQEQDANEWWESVCEIFHELAEKAGSDVVRRVRGMSISSHTVTLLPLDGEGKPVRRAMTYQDNRSSEELRYILDKVGYDRFVDIVGGQPAVAFLPSKILWFENHEPELFAKTAKFAQANSYINYRLTGRLTTDLDQAARTQCLDVHSYEWSEEIGKVLGINLADYIPEITLVDEIIGFVSDEAAEETGLHPGIPVISGCSDAMASMFAAGISGLGEAAESSGTSSLVFIGSDKKSAMDIPVVTRPCPIDGMPWVFDAPITATGIAIKWYIDTFAAEERAFCEKEGKNIFTHLNEIALEAEPGSRGLYFYPYLMGERAPIWSESARGMFIGLDTSTSRAELARAVFEGTAYALRHVAETVKAAGGQIECLRICGGGAKSRTWSMIKASMLRVPVYVLDENSGDVPVGDALIAGHKMGVFPDLGKAVNSIIKVKEIIEPNEEWAKIYDQYYPYYVEMYKSLDSNLQNLRKTATAVHEQFV